MSNEIGGEGLCRSCGAPIVWMITSRGNNMPVNRISVPVNEERFVFNPDAGHVSHFATCAKADRHRKPR